MPSRVWLVTGASSGFGLEMTRCALERGDRVVATLRNPTAIESFASRYPSSQLLVVKLDVRNQEEIQGAFQKAKETFGRIDVVFNNAGYVVGGEAEAVPDDLARAMFEVNFWGAVHVSREAVKFFREENKPQGGHLIQNSACAGIVGFPQLSFYAAAKHALEGFTETLHKELIPSWNIKITSILAGAFPTEIRNAAQIVPQHPAYTDPSSIAAIVRRVLQEQPTGPISDTARGVAKIYELSQLPSPPSRFPLGPDSVQFLREWTQQLNGDVEKYSSWSNDLAINTA